MCVIVLRPPWERGRPRPLRLARYPARLGVRLPPLSEAEFTFGNAWRAGTPALPGTPQKTCRTPSRTLESWATPLDHHSPAGATSRITPVIQAELVGREKESGAGHVLRCAQATDRMEIH